MRFWKSFLIVTVLTMTGMSAYAGSCRVDLIYDTDDIRSWGKNLFKLGNFRTLTANDLNLEDCLNKAKPLLGRTLREVMPNENINATIFMAIVNFYDNDFVVKAELGRK